MAIRDDIDVMLNSLRNGGTTVNKPKSSAAGNTTPVKAPAARKTVYDSMSVDDLLNELTKSKKPAAVPAKPAAPAPERISEPVQVEQSVHEAIPEKINISEPEPVKVPEQPKKKKRIVISGELPDYEAIRQNELAKEAEAKRLAEEAERKAAEEAEAKRLADEAERKASEEAEAKRLAEEIVEDEYTDAENEDISEEEKDDDTDEDIASEEPKSSIFSKIKGLFAKDDADDEEDEIADESPEEAVSDDEAQTATAESEMIPETDTEDSLPSSPEESESDDIEDDMKSAAELVDAALAAIEEAQLEIAEENAADELIADASEENPADEIIEDIRDEAASTIADIEAEKNEFSDESADETESGSTEAAEPEASIDISVDETNKKGRITAALERILDENPAEISSERSEKTEPDDIDVSLEKKGSGNFKKHLYAVFGVIFTVLAVVGLITVVKGSILYIRSFTAGESKMDSFSEVIYPAVIMDIDSFESPSELSSEQIISAALWSLVMSEDEMTKYEETFDVISVPAVDVEAYAAKLFGSSVPGLTHATVGSGELKFYYNEESKAYNVPVKPITFTYEPSIKSVAKSGNNYTVEVDYINELPSWMEEIESEADLIAKTVEFRLTETNGQYHIVGMKVISVNNEI